jgi:hypothetical protein
VTNGLIGSILAMNRLDHLDVSETSISYTGVKRLVGHPSLSRLEVGGLPLTIELLNDLRRRNPQLQISWSTTSAPRQGPPTDAAPLF